MPWPPHKETGEMPTPTIVRVTRHGHPGFVDTTTGRWYPTIAGAEEPTADEAAAAEKAAADTKAAEADAAKKEAERKAPTQEDLDKAYEKLRAAEKAASDGKAAQKKLAELEAAKLSESEKLQKAADDGRTLAEKATTRLRTANLRDALSDKGFNGSKAKAVAKLLDGVEYDDDDEPKNLDDRLKAAEQEYGDLVKPGDPKPKAPDIDNGDKPNGKTPKLTADQLEAAKNAGMTPERYAAFQGGGSIEDFQRVKDAEKKK